MREKLIQQLAEAEHYSFMQQEGEAEGYDTTGKALRNQSPGAAQVNRHGTILLRAIIM